MQVVLLLLLDLVTPWWPWGVLAHLALCLLLYPVWPRRGVVALTLSLVTLLLPGYGAALLLLVGLALRVVPPPQGDLLSEFREHVAPQLPARGGVPLASLPLVEHLKVQPLIDLLQTPDVDLRKAVLEDMARRRGARLIGCLQAALSDPNPEIYQFAVAKLGQVQEWYSQQLTQGRLEYQRLATPDSARLLVTAYQDYLESGLLEKALEPLYLQQLVDLHSDFLERFGIQPTYLLARAEVWLRLDRTDAAESDFGQVLSLEANHPEAELGLLKAAYQRRDWSQWRSQAQRLRQLRPRLPLETRNLLDLLGSAQP